MRSAVKTRKMIETERLIVDRKPHLNLARELSGVNIPSRYVVPSASHDSDAFEKGRNQIDPTLIGEQAVRYIIPTEIIDTLSPPIGKTRAFLRRVDAYKTEIVNAVPETADFIVNNRLNVALGVREMRRQNDVVAV